MELALRTFQRRTLAAGHASGVRPSGLTPLFDARHQERGLGRRHRVRADDRERTGRVMCQRRAHRAENEQAPEFARVAATMHERDARLVRLVGHCSSDNAASYGIYAFGLIPRWTALRDSITLTVYYDSGPTLAGSTGIGLSAVAATKTYLNTVAGLALLAGALLAADPSLLERRWLRERSWPSRSAITRRPRARRRRVRRRCAQARVDARCRPRCARTVRRSRRPPRSGRCGSCRSRSWNRRAA